MTCVLKKVSIYNFKSLRNVEIQLKKFNVLIGPNGAGKTNFIEFFKFLKKALIEVGRRPYVPYLEWWSYRNIVWEGKEELPITGKLLFDIDGFNVEYEVSFSAAAGVFKILIERLVIEKILLLEKEGPILKIRQNEQFLINNRRNINRELKNFSRLLEVLSDAFAKSKDVRARRKIALKDLSGQTWKISTDLPNLLHFQTKPVPWVMDTYTRRNLEAEYIGGISELVREGSPLIIVPLKDEEGGLSEILNAVRSAIANFTVLKHPHMKAVKSATVPRGEQQLQEDSSNLNNILYKWFSARHKLPERIETVISELFPDTQIGFELTLEGKIYLKIYEKGVELHPPCIPDGLYKVLAILAAIELEPSLLAIDELENSLYKEALEYVIDALRESESSVVITTHSPLVVDMVKLEDLVIAEKTGEGTVLSRIKAPQKLRQKLAELKITQSESWLYGELPE